MFMSLLNYDTKVRSVISVAKFVSYLREENNSWRDIVSDIKDSVNRIQAAEQINMETVTIDVILSIVNIFLVASAEVSDNRILVNSSNGKFSNQTAIDACTEIFPDMNSKDVVDYIELCDIMRIIRYTRRNLLSIQYKDYAMDKIKSSDNSVLLYMIVRFTLNFLLQDTDEWNQDDIDYLTDRLSSMTPEEEDIVTKTLSII